MVQGPTHRGWSPCKAPLKNLDDGSRGQLREGVIRQEKLSMETEGGPRRRNAKTGVQVTNVLGYNVPVKGVLARDNAGTVFDV